MDWPRLNLVVLRSRDLDRAETFYRALGITFSREKHEKGPEHLATTLGEVVFEIYPQREATSTIDIRLGFRVTSLETVLATAAASGGVVVSPPAGSRWGSRAIVADPDGHRIELLESSESA